MTLFRALTISTLLLTATSAWSQATAPTAPTWKFLDAQAINPGALLPPPPADGSAQQRAELVELTAMAKARAPERLKQAQFDSDNESPVIFEGVVPGYAVAKLPLTVAVLELAHSEAGMVSRVSKQFFARKRPYEFDASLLACGGKKGTNPAYPSGHTTVGYAMAVTLAELIPEQSGPIMSRAAVFAESRMMCGVHYRSDTVAGQAIGTAVAFALQHSAKFQAEMAKAKAELKAAGLTK